MTSYFKFDNSLGDFPNIWELLQIFLFKTKGKIIRWLSETEFFLYFQKLFIKEASYPEILCMFTI